MDATYLSVSRRCRGCVGWSRIDMVWSSVFHPNFQEKAWSFGSDSVGLEGQRHLTRRAALLAGQET